MVYLKFWLRPTQQSLRAKTLMYCTETTAPKSTCHHGPGTSLLVVCETE